MSVYLLLITSVDLPTVVQILQANQEKPYLGLTSKLRRREVARLTADSHLPSPRARPARRGMTAGKGT